MRASQLPIRLKGSACLLGDEPAIAIVRRSSPPAAFAANACISQLRVIDALIFPAPILVA